VLRVAAVLLALGVGFDHQVLGGEHAAVSLFLWHRMQAMLSSGRRSARQRVSMAGTIYDASGNALMACTLRDISATGARLELSQDVPLPDSFFLALTPDGHVRHGRGRSFQ
jgi:hypothetical protein